MENKTSILIWEKNKKKLPTTNGDYLCYTSADTFHSLHWTQYGWNTYDFGGNVCDNHRIENDYVKLWCELPKIEGEDNE